MSTQYCVCTYADPMAGYQHLDDLVSQLRTAFDEGAAGAGGGAGSGAGSQRSGAAVDGEAAEARRLTDPDMQPGPMPAGLVGSDDPLRMGTPLISTFRPLLRLNDQGICLLRSSGHCVAYHSRV